MNKLFTTIAAAAFGLGLLSTAAFAGQVAPSQQDGAAQGVIIVPGDSFGRNAREYARMSYATSRENIREALTRIAAAAGE